MALPFSPGEAVTEEAIKELLLSYYLFIFVLALSPPRQYGGHARGHSVAQPACFGQSITTIFMGETKDSFSMVGLRTPSLRKMERGGGKMFSMVFFLRKVIQGSQTLIEYLIVRGLCGKLPCFPQMLKDSEPEFRKNVFPHIHPCPRGCDEVGKGHSGQVGLPRPHRNTRIHRI